MSEENVDVARQLIQAFNCRRASGVALWTKSSYLLCMESGTSPSGREKLRGAMSGGEHPLS